jgi:HK97 family phage major capsid protein
MSRIKALEEQIAEKRNAIKAIDAKCENESRNRTPEEIQIWDDARKAIDLLNVELKAFKEEEETRKAEAANNAKKATVGAATESTSEQNDLLNVSKRYDMAKAVRMLAGREQLDGVEAELSQEARNEARLGGASFGYSGVAIPGKVLRAEWEAQEKRTDISQGTSAIQPTVLGSYVAAIRQNAVFSQVIPSSNILMGLTGDYKIPSVGSQALAWATAENSAAADGGANFGKDTLAPVRLTGYANISNRVLLQNGEAAMNAIMADFGRETANKIDGALFSHTNITNAIPAIAATSGTLTFAEAATYAAPSSSVNGTVFDDFLKALQTLANANAAGGALAFVGHTKLMSDLVKSPQVLGVAAAASQFQTGAPLFINLNGVRFYLTTSNTSSTTVSANFIGGDFNYQYLGFFGGLDMSIDPYSVKLNDQQRIVVHRHVDSSLMRAAAMVKSVTLLS